MLPMEISPGGQDSLTPAGQDPAPKDMVGTRTGRQEEVDISADRPWVPVLVAGEEEPQAGG